MKSKITKSAIAAAIVAAAVLSVNIFDKTVPTVFGIEQVIAAYDNIRFLHVKRFKPNQLEPAEFWIKSDQQGHVAKARYYLPVTEDGVKLITWTPEGTEIWFKSKNWLALIQTKRIEGWMQKLMEQCQPKLVMQKLLEEQKAGTVDIDIQKPQDKQEPATITANYKTSPKKEIYYINQETDLITHIEFYSIENGRSTLVSTTKFYDYNVPIDEKIFSLKDEVPKSVRVADRLNQICGVPQGEMSDEQAAAETVRQFCQALIDKDYKKVGLILCGTLEEYAKEEYSWFNVTAIISIGPPIPQPDWDKHGFRVPCELEVIDASGQKIISEYSPYVRPGDDEMHPDRWNITGGWPGDGDFYLCLSNTNTAGRFVITGVYDTTLRPVQHLQEAMKWSKEPEILSDNDTYAKLSPEDVVKAFNNAFAKQDWDEMRKFVPDVLVDGLKHDFEEWKSRGEVKEGQPFLEVIGKAFWSAEHSAYLVRCRDAETEIPPDNEKYSKTLPKEVAEAFFKACAEENLDKFRKFWPRSAAEQAERIREYLFGLKIINIGEPFKKADYPGWFVPYEVKLKDGRVQKNDLAVRNDNSVKRYIVDGGF